MKTITKILIAGLTAMLLSACGSSSSGDSVQDKAIEKISNYAQNGGEVPTLQDYMDAGVTGVANVDDVNTYISGLTKEDVDTNEEIQAIADALGVELTGNIPPIAKVTVSSTTINEGETVTFSAAKSTDTDGTIENYLWTEGYVRLTNATSFSKSDFSVGVHMIQLAVTDNEGAADYEIVHVTVNAVKPAPAPAPAPTPAPTCLENAGYGTVTLANGQIWLDRNLGSSTVGATGSFYQWGRFADGHENPTSNTTTTQATDLNPNHADFIIGSSSWTTADASGINRSEDWSTADDAKQICPCGFVVPDINDINDMRIVDYSVLNFPNGGVRLNSDGTYNFLTDGYYFLTGTVRRAFGTVNGVYFADGNLISGGASVRCIDPASRVAP